MTANPVIAPAHDPGGTLRRLGVVLILAPLLVRATTGTTTLPAWDLDPTIFAFNTPAIGPAGSLLIDSLVLLGAGAVLAAERAAGRRVSSLAILLATIGTFVCLLHGWLLPSPDSALLRGGLGPRRIGVAWIAAIWAALALAHAARDAAVRAVVVAILLAFVVTLAARGLQQVMIEHPASVAAYRTDPDRFRAARGWPEGSSMARAYERRLSQPEATGWFGLANVYASFAVFGVVASAGLLMAAVRRSDDQRRAGGGTGAIAIALAGSIAALWLCDAKGGYAAAGLGLALLFLSRALHRFPASKRQLTRRLAPLLGIACIAGVIAAVVARGLLGQRISELSILFRSFYLEAALRIFAAHPVTGVGPDGFQQAYLLAKNPLSPEEVTSPHSILFDWIATLGIAGAAWCTLMLIVAARAGSVLADAADPQVPAATQPADRGSPAKLGMLILALATIGAAWVDSPYITLDAALVRVAALGAGCLLCVGLCRPGTTAPLAMPGARVALAAAALALLAHGQLDVTFTNTAAAGLAMIAAVAFGPTRVMELAASRVTGAAASALALGIAALALLAGVLPTHQWERRLHTAAAEARVIADLQDQLAALSSTASLARAAPRPDPAAVLRRISAEVGRSVEPSTTAVAEAMLEIDRKRLPAAADQLLAAAAIFPAEWRVMREASRLHLRLAYGYLATKQPVEARRAAEAAVQAIQPPRRGDSPVASASWLRALAVTEEAFGLEADDATFLARAQATLVRAAALDPYNLDIAVRLWQLTTRLGNRDEARGWAGRAIELDDLVRLDKAVRGLSPQDRAAIETAAKP